MLNSKQASHAGIRAPRHDYTSERKQLMTPNIANGMRRDGSYGFAHRSDVPSRVGSFVPEYMMVGHVVGVILRADVPEYLTEYEIDFKFAVGTFYQTQLRLLSGHANAHDLCE
jgi:hypothetical protein